MASTTLSSPESLKFIQIMVAIPLLVFGAYLMSPWYVIMPGATAFGKAALASAIGVKFIGFLMLVSGAGTIWGGLRGNLTRWTKSSIWLTTSLYVFLLVTRLIAVGFVPMIWVLFVPLIGISGVLALSVRTR